MVCKSRRVARGFCFLFTHALSLFFTPQGTAGLNISVPLRPCVAGPWWLLSRLVVCLAKAIFEGSCSSSFHHGSPKLCKHFPMYRCSTMCTGRKGRAKAGSSISLFPWEIDFYSSRLSSSRLWRALQLLGKQSFMVLVQPRINMLSI